MRGMATTKSNQEVPTRAYRESLARMRAEVLADLYRTDPDLVEAIADLEEGRTS